MFHPVAVTARFEPCPAFRHTDDPLVCGCGWLEDDHRAPGAVVLALGRVGRPRPAELERRAS